MKTKLIVILTAILLFAMSVSASQTTITGILTDDMCTKKHMMPGKANADCVRECIKHGAKYVVVANGKVLEVRGDQDKLNVLAGKKVTLTGELKGKVLQLADAQAAQ